MRRLVILLCLAALAAPIMPMAVLAEDAPVGTTAGAIECRRYDFEDANSPTGRSRTPQMPCDRRWDEDVPGGTEWEFDERREFRGQAENGLTYEQSISQTASYRITRDAAGNLTSMEVVAELSTTVSGAGNTEIVLDLDIPFVTDSSVVRLHDVLDADPDGNGNFVAQAEAGISLECDLAPISAGTNTIFEIAGRDVANRREGEPALDVAVETGDGNCILHVDAKVTARNSAIIKSDHVARSTARVELTLEVPPCDLAGIVFDGDLAGDGHANPMSGIPVRLLRDGDETGDADVTGGDGRYCIRGIEADEYEVSATLEDGRHDPPIFTTLHSSSSLVPDATASVVDEDLGRDDLDIVFSHDADRPWLADVANIHWQSERFMRWVTDSLGLAPTSLGTFSTITFVQTTGSHYLPGRVNIAAQDSTYAQRNEPLDQGPDNGEWHETVHHLESVLRFAHLLRQPTSCVQPVYRHGGWQNAATCDSLNEGFAAFLPVWASLEIDADRAGYATDHYAGMFRLEGNGYRPWSRQESVYREDFAVAQLMWDLVDAEVDLEPITSAELAGAADVFGATGEDRIAIPIRDLIGLFIDTKVETVLDVYEAIRGSALVPDTAKDASVDLDGDGTDDVSQLDVVFLMHGFHPVDEPPESIYVLGDPIARTDRPAAPGGTALQRRHMEDVPGSAILFRNGTTAPITYTIEVAYAAVTGSHAVTVAAGEEKLLHLELPPYRLGAIDPAALPACDPAKDQVVTLTISGGGTPPRTMTNCEYWHAVAAAAGDHAVLVEAAGPAATVGATAGPGPSPTTSGASDSSLLVLLAAGVLVLAVGGIALAAVKRQRSGSHD